LVVQCSWFTQLSFNYERLISVGDTGI
jgi:hypothetical protein